MDLSYILNHLGEDRESYRGAVSPPIFQSSIFAFPDVAAMRESFRDEFRRTTYTRGNNPTVEILRKKVAALEGAEDCLMFGSGAGAIAAAAMASVGAGDHAICVARPYSWTRALLRDLLGRFGVTASFIDGTKVDHFAQAIGPRTKFIVLESPNSMTLSCRISPQSRGSPKRTASARCATTATPRRSTSRRSRSASTWLRIRRRSI